MATGIFIVVTLLQMASCGLSAIWPLHVAGVQLTPGDMWASYSLADSNLDVWALQTVYVCVLLLLLRLSALPGPARGTSFRNVGQRTWKVVGSRGIDVTSVLFQLALLSKALIVAILGDDAVMPDPKRPGNSGLAAMFGTIVVALLGSFVQSPAAKGIVRTWEKRSQQIEESRSDDLRSPLLDNVAPGKGRATANPPSSRKSMDGSNATIATLILLSGPDAPILLLAFTAGAAAALGQALIPYYTGRIIDYASIDPDPTAFRHTTLKLLYVAAACAVFTGIRGGLFTISMTRLNVRLRRRLFHSLTCQDSGFFDTTKTGEITSRLAADTTTVSDQISLNLNVMLRSTTQAAMVLAFMFTASWRLSVVTFVMVPVVMAICKVYGRYYRKLSKKVQSELAEANSVAEEALGSMATVKSHAAEGSTNAAYARKLEAFYSLQKREAAAYAAYMATSTFLSAAVVAGVLFYGGSLVLCGAMSAGALVSFMLYQQSLSAAFQALGDVFSALSAAVGAADKVIELMQRQPAVPAAGKLTPPEFGGQLELRDVNFSYPARPQSLVLRNFNLSIDPGEVVALVGPSGGGKSSVVKLLQRFYLPTTGRVLVDGRDVGVYDPGWLRRRMALVSQEPVLYARSVRRNILFGLEADDGVPPHEIPSDNDVEEAAKLANAHDFVMALPAGYDTDCGERGVQLSGGQKQRLAIARALVRRPAVLLLDEATSALDADSEAAVQEALDRTMVGRTVLVIAHRLSTVQGASRIVVVSGGTVVEVGTHQELLDRGEAYAALVRRQLSGGTSTAQLRGMTPSGSQMNLTG